MHKRGLCCHVVSVRPSVRPSEQDEPMEHYIYMEVDTADSVAAVRSIPREIWIQISNKNMFKH